jgi:hypothetical protein
VESASHPGRKRARRDRVRLIARYAPKGYTDRPEQAMHAEPEAVGAQDAEWIAYRVHRSEREAQLLRWREHRARIEREIDSLYSQRFAVGVSKQLRVLRRQLALIERRIAAL